MPKAPRPIAAALRDCVLPLDCMDERMGLPALADKSFAHVVTDPPYGARTHGNKWSGSSERGGPQKKAVTFAAMTESDIHRVARQLVRLARGWVLCFTDEDLLPTWKRALVLAGASRRVTCVFSKPNGTPQFRGEGPAQPCEYLVTAWCGVGKSVWNGGGKRGHYEYAVEPADLRRHETQKPLALMRQLLLDFSRPGELILDPFGGGGQTAVAARQLGRHYLLYERDHKLALIAQLAASAMTEQLEVARAQHRARPAAFGCAPDAPVRQERLL